MSLLVLNSSSRGDGDTGAMVAGFLAAWPEQDVTVVELASLDVRAFTYDFLAPGEDDFHGLMAHVLTHQALLIATPVYWYAMSGHAKIFLDRLTDYLMVEALRPLGRALRGRSLALLAVGAEAALPPGFVEPFRLTAGYLGMEWRGEAYASTSAADLSLESEMAKVRAFAETLGR